MVAHMKAVETFDDFPLSYSQENLWFLDQLSPGSVSYNVPAGLEMRGPLDAAALQACLAVLMARHEALRTSIASVEGQAVQRVHPEMALPFTTVDADDGDAQALQPLIDQVVRTPFDLDGGPLWRARLVRRADDRHVLLLVFHHIVVDGWSIGLLVRELNELMTAHVLGVAADLSPPTLQFADYACWQRETLTVARLEGLLAYWRRRLQGAPDLTRLPFAMPAQHVPAQGALYEFSFPAGFSQRVARQSQALGCTAFMLLLSAFNALLHRLSGQSDLVVGTPVAHRTRAELEGVVGFFVNTLAIRTQVDARQTFRSLVRQVFQSTLDDYEHQDMPFGKLVEAISPRRSAGHAPLFQLMFALQNTPESHWTIPGLQVRTHRLDTLSSKFDLTMSLEEREDGLHGVVEYDAGLFDDEAVSDLVRRYVALSSCLMDQPDASIGSHPLMSEDERTRVVRHFNDTVGPIPDVCLHEAIEEQARRRPQATALMMEGRCLSYQALDEKAQAWADLLIDKGVGPDMPVGVCLHRHEDMLVALLAVLKAGGAYLPIEPDLPTDRVTSMLRTSGTSLVLCHEATARQGAAANVEWLRMDAATGLDRSRHRTRRGRPASPMHLAYVLYTSGSTGTPKGAALHHRGVVNRLHWMWREYGFTENDVFVQKTPFSFDVSVWELFMPLMFGARLVIVRPQGHKDPYHLCEEFARTGVTVAHFVPSMLGPFMMAARHRPLAGLKQIICSGEALGAKAAEAVMAQLGCRLHNLYGPTEASIDVSAWTCRPGDAVVPIGRPIANTRLYILDTRQQPVPVGVAGELYIGGVGLARGYLNRASLTAEKFVPDPFGVEEGGRLYRTGDLARYRRDGQIEYLGRLDHQVKLRGFRIELGEIESALLACAGVREAVVVARGEGAGQQLVGYVGAGQDGPDVGALRQALLARLPGYMVPSHLVVMQALPLSPNGKVDRKSLPEPDASEQSGAVYEAPHTQLEQEMAALWSQVLGVCRVGRHDDFFELGGHSLLATQVIARLQQNGAAMSVAALFRHPTLAAFTAHVRNAAPSQGELLTRMGGDTGVAGPPLVLCHALSGNALPYLALADALSEWHPVFAVERPNSVSLLPASIADIAVNHAGLLEAAFPSDQAIVLGGWSFGAIVAMETARVMLEREPRRRVSLLLIDPTPVEPSGRCPGMPVTDEAVRAILGAYPAPSRESDDLLHVCRLHLEALREHRVSRLSAPGLVLHAAENADAANQAAWAGLTPSAMRIVLHDANHESILRGPAVPTIAQQARRLFLV